MTNVRQDLRPDDDYTGKCWVGTSEPSERLPGKWQTAKKQDNGHGRFSTEPNVTTSAWAYVAVSSSPQEDTLEHQIDWAKRTSAEHGWTITRTFRAVATGKHGVRRHLSELLEALEQTPRGERPERILMIRLDRLGRGDGLETIGAISQLKKLGVRIHTRDDGDVSLRTASESILPVIKSIVAGIENDVRRDKAKSAHERKRRNGEPVGRAPYGLRIEGGKYVVHPTEAPIMREAFALRAKGWGSHRIAMELARRAPEQTFKNGKTRRLGWSATTIVKLLAHRAYVDVGIVDEVTFARVQRPDEHRERWKARYPWPLSHVVRCECGGTLTGMTTGPQRIRYYVCRRSWNHPPRPSDLKVPGRRGDGAWVIQHNALRLEAQFEALLGRLRANPELAAASLDRSSRYAAQTIGTLKTKSRELAAQIAAIDQRIDTAWAAAEAARIDPDELKSRLSTLRAEQAELTVQLQLIRSDIAATEAAALRSTEVVELFARAPRIWRRTDPAHRKLIAKQVALALGGLFVTYRGELSMFSLSSVPYGTS